MGKVGWALLLVIAVTQLVFAVELMELADLVKRTQAVEMETAMMKNDAAAAELRANKLRLNYYEALGSEMFPGMKE